MSDNAFENWYSTPFSDVTKPDEIFCLHDRHPHRSIPLSLGRLSGEAGGETAAWLKGYKPCSGKKNNADTLSW